MHPKPPRPDLTRLSDHEKDRLVGMLLARLDAVEARLGISSQNSSKLPSSVGLATRTRSSHAASNRKAGAQVGTEGRRSSASPSQPIPSAPNANAIAAIGRCRSTRH